MNDWEVQSLIAVQGRFSFFDKVRAIRMKYPNVQIFCFELWNSLNVNVFIRAVK